MTYQETKIQSHEALLRWNFLKHTHSNLTNFSRLNKNSSQYQVSKELFLFEEKELAIEDSLADLRCLPDEELRRRLQDYIKNCQSRIKGAAKELGDALKILG